MKTAAAWGFAWFICSAAGSAMAADTANQIVNPQITDAAAPVSSEVLGDAPSMAMGNLYQATSQSLGNAAHNATAAQQNANTILQATTTQGVSELYETDTAATGISTSEITGGQ